jgi:hypothetical protein
MRLDDYYEPYRLIAAYVAFLDLFAATTQKAISRMPIGIPAGSPSLPALIACLATPWQGVSFYIGMEGLADRREECYLRHQKLYSRFGVTDSIPRLKLENEPVVTIAPVNESNAEAKPFVGSVALVTEQIGPLTAPCAALLRTSELVQTKKGLANVAIASPHMLPPMRVYGVRYTLRCDGQSSL